MADRDRGELRTGVQAVLRHATRRENREPILKQGLLARASPRRNYPDSDDFYECGWSYTPGFGYKLNKDKRPVVVQKDARVVREIFRPRANGEEIATLASEFGLPVTQVRHILGNRFYLGEVRLEEGEKFLEEDERRRFARFIDRIVISPAGLGTGTRVPLAERVPVYFIGDTEPYLMPVQEQAA